MARITAAQARRDFSDVISRSAYGKERIIITRHDADVVAIVPIEEVRLLDAARELLAAHPKVARDLAVIDAVREAQAAWGRVSHEVDSLVLEPDSFDEVVDLLEHPRPASPALRQLMSDRDEE
jgi:prevent-host-death family protein